MLVVRPQAAPDTGSRSPVARTDELEQVLTQTGEAVVVKDLNAIVTYWNREAVSLYGFSAQEAIGRSLRDLHAADLSESDYARVLERIRAGKSTSTTADRRKRNGDTIRVALKTAPLLDAQGELVGEITIARDVSALHRTEEALRIAQSKLQDRLSAVRDANKKLSNEILARRKAAAAVRRNNAALAATVRQLKAVQFDGETLSQAAELLQSSANRAEAYTIVSETGGQLFPNSPGCLFIYRESRDVVEHVISWGSGAKAPATVAPDECWALRLGRPHFVLPKGAIRCRHVQEEVESYVCMPVQGQGQILGLLHIRVHADSRNMLPARDIEQRLRAMADRVGPALANLKLRDALRELALRDSLTGLYNRRYLEDALNRELHRAERAKQPVSMVMIDVDHFKALNDKFGHDAGDFVLSALARAITKNIRPSDIACRYGGEELAVVLSDMTLECALTRIDQMRLAIRNTNLVHLGQILPAPTASFGIAVYPIHGTTPAGLIKAADQALYRAKHEGRDRACVAGEPAPADQNHE